MAPLPKAAPRTSDVQKGLKALRQLRGGCIYGCLNRQAGVDAACAGWLPSPRGVVSRASAKEALSTWGKIHPTHRCAAFSSGDFDQEAVVVCLSCAAYTCGKVYALAEVCKPHLAAKADRKRVLARVRAGAHPGNNRNG